MKKINLTLFHLDLECLSLASISQCHEIFTPNSSLLIGNVRRYVYDLLIEVSLSIQIGSLINTHDGKSFNKFAPTTSSLEFAMSTGGIFYIEPSNADKVHSRRKKNTKHVQKYKERKK